MINNIEAEKCIRFISRGTDLVYKTNLKGYTSRLVYSTVLSMSNFMENRYYTQPCGINRVLFVDIEMNKDIINRLEDDNIEWFLITNNEYNKGIEDSFPDNVWLNLDLGLLEMVYYTAYNKYKGDMFDLSTEDIHALESGCYVLNAIDRKPDTNSSTITLDTATTLDLCFKSIDIDIGHIMSPKDLSVFKYKLIETIIPMVSIGLSSVSLSKVFRDLYRDALAKLVKGTINDSIEKLLISLEVKKCIKVINGKLLFIENREDSILIELTNVLLEKYAYIDYIINIDKIGNIVCIRRNKEILSTCNVSIDGINIPFNNIIKNTFKIDTVAVAYNDEVGLSRVSLVFKF